MAGWQAAFGLAAGQLGKQARWQAGVGTIRLLQAGERVIRWVSKGTGEQEQVFLLLSGVFTHVDPMIESTSMQNKHTSGRRAEKLSPLAHYSMHACALLCMPTFGSDFF